MMLKVDLFTFLWVVLQFSSQLLLQLQHMEWGTSVVSRWCEGNMFYLPIISASATGASWCKSNPEILPSSPLASSVPWKITLFRKCQGDPSSYLVPAILQDGAHHHHSIETDGYLFIFNTRERLKSFLTLLLVRYLGFNLTRNGCYWESQAAGHTAWILSLALCALYTHHKLSSLCWELTSYRFGSYLERNNQVKDTTSLSAPVLACTSQVTNRQTHQ